MSITHPQSIRFKCVKCGICCGNTFKKERHVLLLKKEAAEISILTKRPICDFAVELTNEDPYAYEMKKTAKEGKCFFLNKKRCTIYPERPLICRFYPFGLETDQNQNKFFFTRECPGIGKGKTIEKRDFQKLINLANNRIGRAADHNSGCPGR